MIIIINGTSSSGKSTVSAELHSKLGDGWLYFSMDGYLSLLGPKFWGLHPDNHDVCLPNDICYAKKHADETYEIIIGERCSKLYATIPDVLALIAEKGFHIIVDSLIATLDEFKSYKEALTPYGLLFVYLYASEKTIAQREAARGDRLNGSALHWLKTFECQSVCDFSFNTEEATIKTISQQIIQQIDLLAISR